MEDSHETRAKNHRKAPQATKVATSREVAAAAKEAEVVATKTVVVAIMLPTSVGNDYAETPLLVGGSKTILLHQALGAGDLEPMGPQHNTTWLHVGVHQFPSINQKHPPDKDPSRPAETSSFTTGGSTAPQQARYSTG